MNDVTMLDTSVFAALNRENSGPIVAKDLEDLLAGGGELVVPASVYQEIKNTPDVDLRAAQLRQITDFRMAVQPPITVKDRVDLYDEFARIGAGPRPPLAWNVESKDLPLIADVRIYMRNAGARKVRFFTVERMINSKIAIERDYKIEFALKSRKLANPGKRIPYVPRVAVPRFTPTLKLMGKSFAVHAGTFAIMAALKIFFDRITANMAIRQGFEDLARRVGNEVVKHRGKIAAIQSSGKQAYANVLIEIGELSILPQGDAVSGATAPNVGLERFQISESNLNLTHEDEHVNKVVSFGTIHRKTRSFEVAVSDAEVASFRFIMNEIKRWESAAEPDIKRVGPEDRMLIVKTWRQALVSEFGPLVEPEVLDADMWPQWRWRPGRPESVNSIQSD